MRVIGLIGGMSWESSAAYYRLINELTRERLGALVSAKILMYSVNFQEIEVLQHAGLWDEAAEILIDAAQRLERGGADFLVLCTNTMHNVAAQLEAAAHLPLLHIADCTGERIRAAGLTRIGLLGTAFTMEQEFYRGRLRDSFGLEVLVPGAAQRQLVHRVIYDELCQGRITEASREMYVQVINELVEAGAEGIILGCTEIMLLVTQNDASVPVFDTTMIHAEAAVNHSLEDTYAQLVH